MRQTNRTELSVASPVVGMPLLVEVVLDVVPESVGTITSGGGSGSRVLLLAAVWAVALLAAMIKLIALKRLAERMNGVSIGDMVEFSKSSSLQHDLDLWCKVPAYLRLAVAQHNVAEPQNVAEQRLKCRPAKCRLELLERSCSNTTVTQAKSHFS